MGPNYFDTLLNLPSNFFKNADFYKDSDLIFRDFFLGFGGCSSSDRCWVF